MAIYIKTKSPQGLLDKIKDQINKGKIDTWAYDSDGDFTHCVEQWNKHAWFSPKVESERLVFGIIGNKNIPMTKSLYAVYHGRFIEMLLAHFDTDINVVWPSSNKTTYDNFS